MTKPEKSSLLEEAVTASGIRITIADMEKRLQDYERSEHVTIQRYHVKQEIAKTLKILKELRVQLSELAGQAPQWEAPE